MHGIIHSQLERYVKQTWDTDTWWSILERAGLGRKLYLATKAYPDQEALAIVTAATDVSGLPADEILEGFGEFIVPTLLNTYRSLVDPQWGAAEFLLNTEETIHRVVRMRNPGARPPQLRFERLGPTRLRLSYDSPRKMMAVAKGIIRGVAKHYGNTVTILSRPRSGGTELTVELG